MKQKKTPGSSPFSGAGLSRRSFVRVGASGVVASWFLRSPATSLASQVTGNVTPKGTAKNCIYVSLPGGPSHVDTFDLKEGPWTPQAFAPTSYGDIRWPQGLMPRLAENLDSIALVRSGFSWALVHGLALTWAQIFRNPTGVLGNVAPHIGSVVALEFEDEKNPAIDVLPTFVALGVDQGVGAGYLPATYAPLPIHPSLDGLSALVHPDGEDAFQRRWAAIQTLDAAYRAAGGPFGEIASDYALDYEQARLMVESPEINALFQFEENEVVPYGDSDFGAACLVAKQLLAGRRGTRFIQLSHPGWDHHEGIYQQYGIFNDAAVLDRGLATLIEQLAAIPGEETGNTLLDETLIIVMGEFGRTTGALNGQQGRDHHLRSSMLLAGGGIHGGTVIGKTDEAGNTLVDPGWSAGRDVRVEDLAATVYSALGIDWTTIRYDDPFGRGFEYVPYASDGTYRPIDELFA